VERENPDRAGVGVGPDGHDSVPGQTVRRSVRRRDATNQKFPRIAYYPASSRTPEIVPTGVVLIGSQVLSATRGAVVNDTDFGTGRLSHGT
jgi:hypothetical protein